MSSGVAPLAWNSRIVVGRTSRGATSEVRSDQNRSPKDRWALVCCYNARTNDPYKDGKHPRYTPLTRVDQKIAPAK